MLGVFTLEVLTALRLGDVCAPLLSGSCGFEASIRYRLSVLHVCQVVGQGFSMLVLQEHKLYPQVVEALCNRQIAWREDGVPYILESQPALA